MNEYKTIAEYMDSIEEQFRAAAPRQTGHLSNSIDAKLIKTATGFSVTVEMDDYGFYQDQGVNGVGYVQTKSGRADKRYKVNRTVVKNAPFSYKDKMPPASAFKAYTSNVGQQYAIAQSVYRNGIKPKHFIQPIVDRVEKELLDMAEEDILLYLDIEINNNDNE